MRRIAGAFLLILGIASGVLFGMAEATAGLLGPLSGHWALVLGGGLAYAGGILLLVSAREAETPYPFGEVGGLLLASLAAALALLSAASVSRGWGGRTTAVLALTSLLETVLAGVVVVRVSFAEARRNALFVPAAVLVSGAAIFWALVLLLGGS